MSGDVSSGDGVGGVGHSYSSFVPTRALPKFYKDQQFMKDRGAIPSRRLASKICGSPTSCATHKK
jgi:hypothetical protein